MSKLHSFVAVVLATLALAGAANLASPGEAQADGRLCNGYSQAIWVALTKPDTSSCGGNNPWRQVSWFRVAAGAPCITMFQESAANKTYFYYAVADDGQQWIGSQGVWKENWNNGFNPPTSECFNAAQLRCTNVGANCQSVNHHKAVIGNFTRWTLTISR